MGFLLTNIACANQSGAHVIIINQGRNDSVFWEELPKVFVNPNPSPNISQVYRKIRTICNPGAAFPWDDGYKWQSPDQLIWSFRPVLRRAIHKQMSSYGYFTYFNSTMVIPDHLANGHHGGFVDEPDLRINLWDNRHILPRYPDVLVHYRCSDNVFFENMGLSPFHFILDNIANEAKYIFILTEKPMPSHEALCKPILEALRDDVSTKFPNSTVVLRRGGNIIVVYDMLMNSKLVLCSASSFCFYAATSNVHGQVFFPGRKYYNQYINIANIHTIRNIRSIYEWKINGIEYNESTLSPTFAINLLRNRSYRVQYSFSPGLHEAEDVYESKYGEQLSQSEQSDIVDERYLLELRERIVRASDIYQPDFHSNQNCGHCLPFRYDWNEFYRTKDLPIFVLLSGIR